MDLKKLTGELVKKCLDKGADQAEVYVESGRDMSIRVRNGEIETIQEASSFGAGFRVFLEGKMAFSSSNDLQESSLERAVDQTVS